MEEAIRVPNDERLWAITEALRRGMMIEEIHALSNIDPWFLRKLQGLVASGDASEGERATALAQPEQSAEPRQSETLIRTHHALPFAIAARGETRRIRGPHDCRIAGVPEMKLRALRKRLGIVPDLQDGGYLRRRVRGRDALLLLLLRHRRRG